MDQLPSSIEAYLEEAGFSGTEILILRRLMVDEPLTIRQLGAKTGKSTGVLDQAMKKLIKKNIVKKTVINDAPRYALDSLESVVEWMQEDMEQKREMLLRRHQNFESFVTSLESGSKRPDIEYFEGESGIKQAYLKLLNGPGEILHYLPVQTKEEEDPLRDFRVQYFRERQNRKMFSRVLAHDTPLGRRYQSRDVFEYRKTVLVPEGEYPFTFEKIITGDRVACLDHKAKTACVIRYAELADIERTLFEAIWRQTQQRAVTGENGPLALVQEPKKEEVAFSTASLSRIREFFLSPKSLVAVAVCAFLAATVTYGLYRQNVSLNKDRIKERAKSIAATAALQFDAADIDQLRTPDDVRKPAYSKVVHTLNRIRRENEGVAYAYVMRPTNERGVWRFVADADALDPFVKRDVNGDGVIDAADHLSPPGETYVEPDGGPDQYFTLDESASYDAATDQWGTFITGSAPIRDDRGQPVAIVGIDVDVEELRIISNNTFASGLYFVGFFLLFVLLRLAAFNRSLFREVCEIMSVRKIAVTVLVIGLLSALLTFLLYVYARHLTLRRIQDKVVAIAATAVSQIDYRDLEELQEMADYQKPEWAKVVNTLKGIRVGNSNILYAYIFRRSDDPSGLEFVADAHALNPFANTDSDPSNDVDQNQDGYIDGSPEGGDYLAWPGQEYPNPPDAAFKSFDGLQASAPYEDQYGKAITGYAPIYDDAGNVVAMLAVDFRAELQQELVYQVFTPVYVFFVIYFAFLVLRFLYLKMISLFKF